jgi:hypothetical protein
MLVKLPRLNTLAVDFVAALFRLTNGDVEIGTADVNPVYTFKVVNIRKFKEKINLLAEKAENILKEARIEIEKIKQRHTQRRRKSCASPRVRRGLELYCFLGGDFVREECKHEIWELASEMKQYTETQLQQWLSELSTITYYLDKGEGRMIFKWGHEKYVKHPPPLLESIEFMEGLRPWPVIQLSITGGRKVRSGLSRSVVPSCNVLKALILGVTATYVTTYAVPKRMRFLVPLSPVEHDVFDNIYGVFNNTDFETRVRKSPKRPCDLPESLMRLVIAALVRRPAVFRVIDIAYEGGKEVRRDETKELIISTENFKLHILTTLGRHASALLNLAKKWCDCDRSGWPKECDDVARAGTAAAKVYLYAETGDLERAYEALSSLLRLSRDVACGVERLVGWLVW